MKSSINESGYELNVDINSNEKHSLKEQMEIPRKSKLRQRWPILILSCLLLFGDYYAYDVPYTVKEKLKSSFNKQYSSAEFEYMFHVIYTSYQFPNIFLTFLSGYLSDKVGLFFFFNPSEIQKIN